MTVMLTYKNGTFVPETAVNLAEGTQVEVDLPYEPSAKALETRRILMERFPGTIGLFTHEEAEEMRREIDVAFNVIDDPRDC